MQRRAFLKVLVPSVGSIALGLAPLAATSKESISGLFPSIDFYGLSHWKPSGEEPQDKYSVIEEILLSLEGGNMETGEPYDLVCIESFMPLKGLKRYLSEAEDYRDELKKRGLENSASFYDSYVEGVRHMIAAAEWANEHNVSVAYTGRKKRPGEFDNFSSTRTTLDKYTKHQLALMEDIHANLRTSVDDMHKNALREAHHALNTGELSPYFIEQIRSSAQDHYDNVMETNLLNAMRKHRATNVVEFGGIAHMLSTVEKTTLYDLMCPYAVCRRKLLGYTPD